MKRWDVTDIKITLDGQPLRPLAVGVYGAEPRGPVEPRNRAERRAMARTRRRRKQRSRRRAPAHGSS